MKLAASLALAGCLQAGAALAAPPTPSDTPASPAEAAAKPLRAPGVNTPRPQVGGDTIATATNIPALPYTDTGNTCSYTHDYDEVCPYTGSLSPDVVYQFVPPARMWVAIDLCASLYDTKVYVYENGPGHVVACNDDADCGYSGWQSYVDLVVEPGNVYYIVVDGYGSDCGEYDMTISQNLCCCAFCPPGGVAEGEPVCYDGYEDHTNGGCNSTPEVFLPAPCSADGSPVTLCGTYGGFLYGGLDYRDTDWFTVDGDCNTDGFTWCLTGDSYSTIMGYIATRPCDEITTFDEYLVLDCMEPGCLEVPAGDYILWVATAGFGPDEGCGYLYYWTTDGYDCCPVSVEPASWGEIKGSYR
jgi:hypothetical protein